MSDYQTVAVEKRGAVALVTMNRPDKLNAFDRVMRRELLQAAQAVNADQEVLAVVLTGAGRAFSAGADLGDTLEGDRTSVGRDTEDVLNNEYKPIVMAIADAPKPWIAAVNGAAAGIGSAYAMACDLSVMGEGAYLYQAFGAIGLVPDGGATRQLVRTVGRRRAFEIIVTGEKVGAMRCHELGLCNRVVADEAVLSSALEWAEEIAGKAPLAVRYAKKALYHAEDNDLANTISYEATLQHICLDSADSTEGVAAFFEKRAARWQGR
jgi:2-(1,2-epoxy-1,2-dihydrophenyl)acetyl-CoA isomerase